MDFETTLKIIVSIACAVAIPVATYAAVSATRAIWGRPAAAGPGELERLREEVDLLSARLEEMDGVERRMGELEERLEFTERLLARQRSSILPPRVDTPPEPVDALG
jgi:hypothetical protein